MDARLPAKGTSEAQGRSPTALCTGQGLAGTLRAGAIGHGTVLLPHREQFVDETRFKR